MTTTSATAPEGAGSPESPRGDSSTTVRDTARRVAAVAMLGAAIIHFTFAPEHLDAQASHGAFFLAVGWLQVLGAGGLGFGWRPRRAWLLGTAAVNVGVAAVWLLTRTAGLPGDPAEAVGFPDTLATALEVVAAAAALAVAFGWLSDHVVRRPAFALTAVPAVAIVAVVTASLVTATGGGHNDDHGGDHAPGETAGADHGHQAVGESAAAVAPEDWNAFRTVALSGNLPADEVARLRQINMDHLADEIRTRSRALASLPEAEREQIIADFVEWSVDHALLAENGSETGEPTMHSHGITQWQPITDPDDQLELQAQLSAAGTRIPEMATAADAMAAGYFQVTPYVPGIGAHYLNIRLLTDAGFDPAHPEMVLYNGNDPTSELVGLSYAVLAEDAPEGFVGPNDEWHQHPSLCIIDTMVVGPDSTPEEMCDEVGGRKGMGFEKPMWMGHLWQVPGWESPWGLFSGENPVVNLATSDVGH